jgi:hypothetical protein
VPVLARRLEAAGFPTVTVTTMPDIAEALGAPRVVGVEFPFGHPFGWPGAAAVQQRVLATAVTVLAGAPRAGTRIDIDVAWPTSRAEAYKSWQPAEASPIVAMMLARNRQDT